MREQGSKTTGQAALLLAFAALCLLAVLGCWWLRPPAAVAQAAPAQPPAVAAAPVLPAAPAPAFVPAPQRRAAPPAATPIQPAPAASGIADWTPITSFDAAVSELPRHPTGATP
jgi:hypothetical protein